MQIKYSKQKQELRDDPVIDFLLEAKQFFVKNVNTIVGAGIVIVFAAGFFGIYQQMHRSGETKAEEMFGRAMIEYTNRNIEKAVEQFRNVADNHRSTPQGFASAQMLGSIFLSMQRHDDAIKWFEIASTAKQELGFVGGEALVGLATCYEAKGDLSRAIEYLEKAIRDDRIRYRHGAVRWQTALLYQKNNNTARAMTLCREIMSDTTAT
ncbi:MAG: tetratricopeptide repeat protein, partial [Chitinispirillaceae bacterium]|nr:tetratricopeptide repeat protein [Chitinispirillaceae bacterium]